MIRKHTKFQTCERHRWLDGESRYRRAEFFMEGGPASSTKCSGGCCRIWPGTDIFHASICTGEYALDWTGCS